VITIPSTAYSARNFLIRFCRTRLISCLEEVFLPEAKDGWFDLIRGKWEPVDVSTVYLSQRLDALESKLDEVFARQATIFGLLKSRGQ
jgi:hypothetical protein